MPYSKVTYRVENDNLDQFPYIHGHQGEVGAIPGGQHHLDPKKDDAPMSNFVLMHFSVKHLPGGPDGAVLQELVPALP